jgi:crossover junction endodeoxyribonuclease RuvC
MQNNRVLAIDPGFERLGIAILDKDKLLYSDCFKTSPKDNFYVRLRQIGEEISRIIDIYEPTACAIETLFFETNKKTAMKVAEARGVVAYEAARRILPIFEFSPLQIKVAITSHGRSDKKQIIFMVPKLIKIDKEIKHDDEYDAIAIGLTYFSTVKNSCKNF